MSYLGLNENTLNHELIKVQVRHFQACYKCGGGVEYI